MEIHGLKPIKEFDMKTKKQIKIKVFGDREPIYVDRLDVMQEINRLLWEKENIVTVTLKEVEVPDYD